MAMRSKTGDLIIPTPKKSRQGCGQHTKYAATSRNKDLVSVIVVKVKDE